MQGELGKGGMGVVYAATQLEPRMPVAIKVLHMAGAEALARFSAEIDIMKRLDHPSIARVIEVGEANGHPFMVMERIFGKTLDAYVKAVAPSLPTKLELFAKVCDAVHYAHDEGVIHRDLKPGNIMVRDDGTIAILDFGVARVSNSARTKQGDFLGTLMYMSPEQATARIDQIDHRTDIYSLGVILFELVRGQMPYDLAGLYPAPAVRTIVSQPPRPLGSPDRELDAICAQALSKQKQYRQASAAELARQIRGLAILA
jgi:serine/threonine protein kinase